MEIKFKKILLILLISTSAFAVDESCMNKALDGIERVAKLPPGADDFFRKRMQASMGLDPSVSQVEILIRADRKIKVGSKADGEKILRESGLFTEDQIKKIASNDLNSPTLAATANSVSLAPRDVANIDGPKAPPPVNSQGSAPRVDTPSAKLADAMETGRDVQKAFQQSQAEVRQIISKTGGNNLSVDQLADFSTRGLPPSEAVKYMKSAVTNDADFTKAAAAIDRKIASVSSNTQGNYSAAQMQAVKVEMMEAYYAQKFKVKPGYSIIDAIDDDALEKLQAAQQKLEELKKRKSGYWPTGS